jgi:2-polyprenyl-6-methoxyphenol hydroxylase-like FAD-dependent oxidoreductase
MARRESEVLVVGAGPTGLTLAIELARRGIDTRLIDRAGPGESGSRGKGLQPRTLELFDLAGVLEPFLTAGALYPPMRVRWGPIALPIGRLSKPTAPTADEPHPNLWMVPQFKTEELLRAKLESLGGRVEHHTALRGFTIGEDEVEAELDGGMVRARFLVGCDGGRSLVRKTLNLPLEGEALPGRGMVVADVRLSGQGRQHWDTWPLARGGMLTLCPLPGTDLYQLIALSRTEPSERDLSLDTMRRRVEDASGGRVKVLDVRSASIYRPHARMVMRYRVGRTLLAGDAAHVHPPSGGQGLNTGVQDAFNLGWKLALVLRGASADLLETYEAERVPVAAAVLGLSTRLLLKPSVRRGDAEKQLRLTYRDGPLGGGEETSRGQRAGDRAPDAPVVRRDGSAARLFELLRSGAPTIIDLRAAEEAAWPDGVAVHRLRPSDAFGAVYGNTTALLVRPDGYLGAVSIGSSVEALHAAAAKWSPEKNHVTRSPAPSVSTASRPATSDGM